MWIADQIGASNCSYNYCYRLPILDIEVWISMFGSVTYNMFLPLTEWTYMAYTLVSYANVIPFCNGKAISTLFHNQNTKV